VAPLRQALKKAAESGRKGDIPGAVSVHSPDFRKDRLRDPTG
jgi:hypothetical protein